MKHQSIPRVMSKFFIPLIMLFGLYVQFHGDFGPGGGFQAGVIFAAAVVLYALIFGLDEAQRVVRPAAIEILVAAGVLIYALTGALSLFLGGEFLNYNVFDPQHPAHGQHLGILFVELGVGVTVAAVIMSIFFSFAGRGKK